MRQVLCPVLLCACASGDVSDQLEVIADGAAGLARPQDLAFDNRVAGRLWVVNRQDDSVTLVHDATGEAPTTEHLIDPYALHFMDRLSSIAFGTPGHFGTCQDSMNTYNGATEGDGFMGPALWSSDLETFAKSNPDAVEFLTDAYGMPVDLGSHLDMLHQSPLCVGIAWARDNVYWVFDGLDGALVRYDFREDHGHGFDDHSDGTIARYAAGEVSRVDGTVSHLAYDAATGVLYAADSGGGRVLALDTATGERGRDLFSVEPGVDHHEVDGAETWVVADGGAGLVQPAGIELIEGRLVVTDAGTGEVFVLGVDGVVEEVLETGLGEGRLAGVTGVSLADLWLVDQDGRVLRLQR